MELTNDHRQADVVILYCLNLGRALLVDKRSSATAGPWVEVFPQQELLLEGSAVEAPLTPRIVHLIERRQVLPADQRIMQSYFRQLLHAIAFRLRLLRPALPEPRWLAIGPHFSPIALLAVSDLWRGLLRELDLRGGRQAVEQARAKLRELYALDVLQAERRSPDELEVLREDLARRQVYRTLSL